MYKIKLYATKQDRKWLNVSMSTNTKLRSNTNLKNNQMASCIDVKIHKCKPKHNHPNLILFLQCVHPHRWEIPYLEFQECLFEPHHSLLNVLTT